MKPESSSSAKNRTVLETWKRLWTTERNDYILVKVQVGREVGYNIYHIPSRTMLIIENDDECAIVINQMLKANSRIMELDEFKEFTTRPRLP